MFSIIYIRQDSVWYLVQADKEGKATWTLNVQHAQMFPTKNGATGFKTVYVSGRNCAVIKFDEE